ncbi:MAG: twin-arginine translocase TatA/TatE family subunit [Acidimicrobiales bacterium]
MGSVGPAEILVVLVLALLVLGPERLPQAARTLGRWVGELRRLTGSLQSEVQGVVDEVMRPVNETATVATDSFTSTFANADVGAETEGATTAASPSSAASDPPSGGGEAPADPSLN